VSHTSASISAQAPTAIFKTFAIGRIYEINVAIKKIPTTGGIYVIRSAAGQKINILEA
jgi:hypothetical protein